jgi:pimeloyl-ACP methyl ester carboxylesterase
MNERDLKLDDGRTVRVYDKAPDGADAELVVFWHHGTPNIGTPPAPLFPASDRLGIRWVSYDRPGYGGSTRVVGRDLAVVAADVKWIADTLGIGRFAVMGHSGGGSHALACAALHPDRVSAVLSVSGLAPYGAEGLDWFAGMSRSGEEALRAAAAGLAEKERYEASAEYDPEMFAQQDHAALEGEWSWFGSVVHPAIESGPGGQIDDDIAYVTPWGCDPTEVTVPVLLLHGERDRVVPSSHGEWLARHCPRAELRLYPDDGHISVLHAAADALDRLHATAGAA